MSDNLNTQESVSIKKKKEKKQKKSDIILPESSSQNEISSHTDPVIINHSSNDVTESINTNNDSITQSNEQVHHTKSPELSNLPTSPIFSSTIMEFDLLGIFRELHTLRESLDKMLNYTTTLYKKISITNTSNTSNNQQSECPNCIKCANCSKQNIHEIKDEPKDELKYSGTSLDKPQILLKSVRDFFENKKSMSKSDMIYFIFNYVRNNNLVTDEKTRDIICDEKLKTLLKIDKFNFFELGVHIQHLFKK
jgi:hypothetical protein